MQARRGSLMKKYLDYTRRARVAPLGTLVWKTFDVNLVGHNYILRKTFSIFSSKKLDVVTITRYQNTFWIFDFSLFEILHKYMNQKLMPRSLYAP